MKVSAGKKARGKSVPNIWTKSSSSVARNAIHVKRPIPITHSQVARIGSAILGVTMPNVMRSMVRPASCSAGDRPGKNLRTPNQKNTMPNATRDNVTPCFAIHAVTRISIGWSDLGKDISSLYHPMMVKQADDADKPVRVMESSKQAINASAFLLISFTCSPAASRRAV
jgi:hypothetical protein